jgi:branched-chain amino acid aminotransferase
VRENIVNESWVYYNGRMLPPEQVRISPYDRGLTLGDGLFETLRVYAGRLFRLDAHLARLAAGAGVIDLALPAGLDVAVRELVAANGWREAMVRLTVTRGAAVPGRGGLLPDPDLPPTVLITGRSLAGAPPYPAAWYAGGIGLATGGPPRNEHSPLSRCKTLQYLDQVLARQAAARRGAEEGLQQNTAGAVAGASVANLFVVRAGQVRTPSLASGCLPGVTRAVVLTLARARGLVAREETLSPAEVREAEEVFLTNTLMEVLPVTRLDGAPVGAGRPGPVTRALAVDFRALCGQGD